MTEQADRAGLTAAGFRMLAPPIEDELGAWYEAEQAVIGRRVTVRVVTVRVGPEQLAELDLLWSEMARRFLPPAIPAVVAHGTTTAGHPWVATDGPSGEALGDRKLAADEFLALSRRISEAINGLHKAGLAHGSISPATIVSHDGSWWLRDVGIAAIVLPGLVGRWTAPEVRVNAETAFTAAADMYALAVTLFEAPAVPLPTFHRLAINAASHADPQSRMGAAEFVRVTGEDGIPAAPRAPDEVSQELAVEPSDADEAQSQRLDEDVQFTVYRPGTVRPGQWHHMLAFAHKSQLPEDGTGQPDPLEEVRRQAEQVLGPEVDDYRSSATDSSIALEWGSDLRFVPYVEGIEFNPPSRAFRWLESVHREDFRLRAAARLNGQTARGRLSVFFGTLLIAEVSLGFRVDDAVPSTAVPRLDSAESARPYRKIFVSYSHRDSAVVDQVAAYAQLLGDEYVRDWTNLRSGEVWSERLAEMIRAADVFQLFWSTNSMASRMVQQEWNYALSLDRPSFVRPVYWEEPLPARPDLDLPPEALRRLHFQLLAASKARAGAAETTPPGVASTVEAETESGERIRTAPTMRPRDVSLPREPAAAVGEAGREPDEMPAPPRRRKRRLVVIGVGVALAAVLAVLALDGARVGDEPPPPPPMTTSAPFPVPTAASIPTPTRKLGPSPTPRPTSSTIPQPTSSTTPPITDCCPPPSPCCPP